MGTVLQKLAQELSQQDKEAIHEIEANSTADELSEIFASLGYSEDFKRATEA